MWLIGIYVLLCVWLFISIRKPSSMIGTFSNIYETGAWGGNDDSAKKYKGTSGGGSDPLYLKDTYVPVVRDFIKKNNIKSVCDLGCGSFLVGKMIYDDLDVKYIGYDAYEKVINEHKSEKYSSKYDFIHLDFKGSKEDIKSADLCIIKDVLQHWSLSDIYEFMDYIVESKKFKYIITCNDYIGAIDNSDIETGGWRPLSIDTLPLKKYTPTYIYEWDTKMVCLITC
jgi:hypothetical protein